MRTQKRRATSSVAARIRVRLISPFPGNRKRSAVAALKDECVLASDVSCLENSEPLVAQRVERMGDGDRSETLLVMKCI